MIRPFEIKAVVDGYGVTIGGTAIVVRSLSGKWICMGTLLSRMAPADVPGAKVPNLSTLLEPPTQAGAADLARVIALAVERECEKEIYPASIGDKN